jgi:hypothetical protein
MNFSSYTIYKTRVHNLNGRHPYRSRNLRKAETRGGILDGSRLQNGGGNLVTSKCRGSMLHLSTWKYGASNLRRNNLSRCGLTFEALITGTSCRLLEMVGRREPSCNDGALGQAWGRSEATVQPLGARFSLLLLDPVFPLWLSIGLKPQQGVRVGVAWRQIPCGLVRFG